MNKKSTNPKPFWLISLMLLTVMILAACQSASTPTPSAPAVPTMVPATATVAATATEIVPVTGSSAMEEAVINVAEDAKLGKILVDAKGMTLYMFTKDEADKSNCSEGCLKAWPPLLSQGSPKAGAGVDQSLLGTATLADGSKIVTYNHMPLYYWAKDTKPGDTTGQDVNGVWYVVTPAGKAVMGGVTINVAEDDKLGKILVDAKGMTLYMFTKDEADKSNCSEGCLKAWPPLLTEGDPKAGDGVDQSLLGTATLADGSKIVTYNHMPLYYWAKDTKPGDTTGQDVNGVWYVVSPDGKVVMDKAASTDDDMYGSSGSKTPVATDDSASAAASDDVKIRVASVPNLGQVLVDGQGMVLYMFTKDEPDKSNCAGECLKAWPPLLDNGNVKAEDGVDQSLIGSAVLPDGQKIVTYNKMPLYYWVGDVKPGDATGQGVNSVWYVVSPEGMPVGR